MKTRALALIAIVLGAGYLYARRLDFVPAHIGFDEVYFALNAHAIATIGRGTDGTFLPLYFHIGGVTWYQPTLVYAMALVFRFLPVSEATARLPTVIAGLASIVLMYFVARAIFKRETLAFIAAVLMALTPAHYLMSRQALDYILPVPYVLVWLWCLASFANRPRRWVIGAGVLALGVGFYTYMASVLMMPLYFAMTVAFVAASDVKPKGRYLAETLMFFLPLLPLVPWAHAHPSAYTDQIGRYHIYDAKRFNPLQGLKEFLNYVSLTQRIAMYWGYIGPNYLFVSGGTKLTMTTRFVGVFLLPLAVFLPVGIYRMLTTRRDPVSWLLVAGFATAPAAALLVDDPFAIDREMNMLPFGVLLATFGVGCLLSAARLWVRVLAIGLLALLPWQFASFYRDYFGDYRVRSAEWFAPNVRDGVEQILSLDDPLQPARVYLDLEIGNIENYWRFYLIKHHRDDLLARTTFFRSDSVDVNAMPDRSLVLTEQKAVWRQPHTARGTLAKVSDIREPDGGSIYVLLERRGHDTATAMR
jgi:4-amino-4-deoxy-L-arabinose transferase-like glycosyltransferase